MSEEVKPTDATPTPVEPPKVEEPKAEEPKAVEGAKPAEPVQKKLLCREKARSLVHRYALFGTAWAIIPLPGVTSTGLTALEAHMIYWIARTYGEAPNPTDIAITTAGLEMASVGLKRLAVELAGLVPVVGWGIKGVVAGGTIEGMGEVIIRHFESKYPNKEVA